MTRIQALTTVALVLAAFAPGALEAEETMVLCDSNNPPYTSGVENGGVAAGGTVVELAQRAFERIDGWDVEVRIYPWVRCLTLARRGEVDGVLKLLRSEERAEYLEFTRPIYQSVQRFFYLKERFQGGVRWTDWADLGSYVFGIVKDASYGKGIDDAVAAGVLRAEVAGSDRQNLEKLLNGRVDLVPTNEQFGWEHLRRMDGEDRVAASEQVTWSRDVHIGISRKSGRRHLLPEIDRALEELEAEVGLASIVRQDGP